MYKDENDFNVCIYIYQYLNFRNILVFINYLIFKHIFNLYIKINLKMYKTIISIKFEKKN